MSNIKQYRKFKRKYPSIYLFPEKEDACKFSKERFRPLMDIPKRDSKKITHN